MRLWNNLHNFFLPTQDNVYRPHSLGRASIMLFFAATLAVEGFLVAGLVARESNDTFLAAALESPTTSPSAVSILQTASVAEGASRLAQGALRIAMEFFTNTTSVNVLLASIALILLTLVLLAFVLHWDIQAHDMLLRGLTVAALALVCMLGNMFLLGSTDTQSAQSAQAVQQ